MLAFMCTSDEPTILDEIQYSFSNDEATFVLDDENELDGDDWSDCSSITMDSTLLEENDSFLLSSSWEVHSNNDTDNCATHYYLFPLSYQFEQKDTESNDTTMKTRRTDEPPKMPQRRDSFCSSTVSQTSSNSEGRTTIVSENTLVTVNQIKNAVSSTKLCCTVASPSLDLVQQSNKKLITLDSNNISLCKVSCRVAE